MAVEELVASRCCEFNGKQYLYQNFAPIGKTITSQLLKKNDKTGMYEPFITKITGHFNNGERYIARNYVSANDVHPSNVIHYYRDKSYKSISIFEPGLKIELERKLPKAQMKLTRFEGNGNFAELTVLGRKHVLSVIRNILNGKIIANFNLSKIGEIFKIVR